MNSSRGTRAAQNSPPVQGANRDDSPTSPRESPDEIVQQSPLTDEQKATLNKQKLAHIPRFLKRINSTLFVKATAEQLFLVQLDIEKKKLEKLRRIPKPKALRTQSDRSIQLPKPERNQPLTNKKKILGSLLPGIRRPYPVVINNYRKEDGSEKVVFPGEVNIDAEQAEKRADVVQKLNKPKIDNKKTDSKIINVRGRSKKDNTLSSRDKEIEDDRSVHSE